MAQGAGTVYYTSRQASCPGNTCVSSISPGSSAFLRSLSLPSGTYLINATVTLASSAASVANVDCIIVPANGDSTGVQSNMYSQATIPTYGGNNGGSVTLSVQGMVVNQPIVSVYCDTYGYAPVNVGSLTLTATQVGTLVRQ